MTRFHSHNQYCDTWSSKHNILCSVSSAGKAEAHNSGSRFADVVGFVVLAVAAYLTLSLGAILDMIVAGGQ